MPAKIQFQKGERIPSTRLRYLEERPPIKKRRQALFVCDCGNQIERDVNWVRFLNIASCGCLKSELITQKNTKHSQAIRGQQTGSYKSWQAMHNRVACDPYYVGKRKICDRWSGDNGFQNFYEDMGDRPEGLTLERIDNDGDYEPSNCKWATRLEQVLNKSNQRKEEDHG